MKKILLAIIVITIAASLNSCITTRDTAKINKVEMGMSQKEILHLLGKPLFKNADEAGEEWGYRKIVGEIAEAEKMLFIVAFDTSGKVVAYKSVKEIPPYYPY